MTDMSTLTLIEFAEGMARDYWDKMTRHNAGLDFDRATRNHAYAVEIVNRLKAGDLEEVPVGWQITERGKGSTAIHRTEASAKADVEDLNRMKGGVWGYRPVYAYRRV